MKIRLAAILSVLMTTCLAACSGGGGSDKDGGIDGSTDTDADADSDTDTDADTDSDTDTDTDSDTDPGCASGCLIDDVCYADGSSPDDDPCLHCDTSVSSTAWSDNDGASCSDGLFCTVDDVCSGGTCGGSARDCSDGVDCTGEETCDEDGDTCVTGTTTCGDFSLCDVATDTCVSTCTNGCVIDSACYGDGQVNPLNPCQVCDPSAVGDAGVMDWADNDGASCDDGLFCNGDDTCSAGVCVSSGDPCAAGGQGCVEDGDICCTSGLAVYGPVCNSAGDVVELDDCGDEMLVEDCLDSTSNGACYDGVCGCASGFAGDDCDECRYFVTMVGDNSAHGNSWALALATVQAGLDAAASRVSSGDFTACEVWVAAGAYVPTSGSGRSKTLTLKANVAIYGGFAGTESVLSERNVSLNRTVLSGDLDMDGDTSDNAYHVVTGATGATIDGFTITLGNADGSGSNDRGGGMYNYYDSPTVTNCTFSENAAHFGGGMFNHSSSPTVTNCTFLGNEGSTGGGMCNSSSSPTVTNCTFSENAAHSGGGMCNSSSSSPTVTNCTFSENAADDLGGGMSNIDSSSPTVTNCIFWDDSAGIFGPEIHNFSSSCSPTITYSIVEGGYTGTGNLNANPMFVSSTNLSLQSSSPAVDAANGCVAPLTDKDANGRVDVVATDNSGLGPAVDMGAYEYQGGSSDLSVELWDDGTHCCALSPQAYGDHDYLFCDDTLTWAAADAYCQANGMHLASIEDSAEDAVVDALQSGSTSQTFIGANDRASEGTWVWSSGDAWSYTNWSSGEPNNSGDEDCGAILSSSGNWNDAPCANTYPFVCETTN